MKGKLLKTIHIIILVVICGMLIGPIFLNYKYPGITFDELLFNIKIGVGYADIGVITNALKLCIPATIILIVILYTFFYDITFGAFKIKFKKIQIYPFKFINNHRIIFTLILFLFSIITIFFGLRIDEYIKNNNSKSGFIAKHYIDSHKVNVKFNDKRNLIFIFAESLETSFFTEEQGGNWGYEVIPELYDLLNDKDSITFYNKNKYQGVNSLTGSTFTTGSIVANTTGVPFKVPNNGNEYYSKYFMNGTYALGDLLKDNGYYNEILSAATTSFGGIKEYFAKHGNYNIVDIDSLKKDYGKIKKENKSGWGINDNYLFEIAKKRLKKISKSNQPFNMELITIDTHFPNGYIGDYSIKKFGTSYENAYATESKLISDFVKWIKKQNFYKNTTIVIVGDHLNMLNSYFNNRGINQKNRYIYNCIINPAIKTTNNNNRIVTSLDFYPTTVAAIGGKIDGNKLALGVNLFSKNKTLAEKYGIKKLNIELKKKSKFYDSHILNDGYINRLKRIEKKKKRLKKRLNNQVFFYYIVYKK